MDHEFPQQLFPAFYNCGPPDSDLKHCGGGWASYDRVRPEGVSGPLSNWTFTSRHQVKGETWLHTEPVPLPLLSPKHTYLWTNTPPDPKDYIEHMQNFFVDHCQDAFGCMGQMLGENFNFKKGKKERYRRDSIHMWKVKNLLDMLQFKTCPKSYSSRTVDKYSELLSDVVHSVPPQLLGSLLFQELTEQRDRLRFSEASTGGALDFVPFSQSDGGSQHGCLLYPGKQGLNQLNFHRVELQHHRGRSLSLTCSSSPLSCQLKGPIRQISSASLLNQCCVAVRSDYLCGVWRLSHENEPHLMQVVNTGEVATCVNASPHILGEVLVASESGAANLWTVGRGIQTVRKDDSNMYFNAKSSWRWCEFTAHPRVMLYADRSGVELTDIRESPVSGHTLFRISSTSECRRGERVILSRYLRDVHSFHHLITTQYSAYIMDERFACVPMLKWDHMMQSPPLFCHVLPGSVLGCNRTTKVVLGAQSSQELTLLQYSGGRAEACSSRGPPLALHRPRDSMKHLPVQLPHRLDIATNRLSSHAAGLTCVQMKGGREAGGEESICVLQLTEAGDVFYQILEPEQRDANASRPPAAEDEPTLSESTAGQLGPNSQVNTAEASSDEDVIGPTQCLAVPPFVAETPERELQSETSEDSESDRKRRSLTHLGLQVIINDDPDLSDVSEFDAGVEGEEVGRAEDTDVRDCTGVEETTCSHGNTSRTTASEQSTQVKLSEDALMTWNHWLQKLIQKSRKQKPRPHSSQYITVETGGRLQLPAGGGAGDVSEEERVRELRRDLRACMSRCLPLIHSSVSDSLRAPDLVPLPDVVDTDVWGDELSQRLTLSWQGVEVWQAWWKEKLGLNQEQKMKALKRKRRREKEAKRAAGLHVELSESFTSSISYQLDLDSFSDSAGWSSASQGAWSDSERMTPLSRTTSPAMISGTTDATASGTHQSVQDKEGERQTAVRPESSAANQRRDRRPAGDYGSPLVALQTLQLPGDVDQEERTSVGPSQPVPLRSLRVDLSKDSFVWPRGLSQSQGSQGRPGPSQSSQSSQAKRKKSRMGF